MNSHIRPLPALPAFIAATLAARQAAALIVPVRTHKLPSLPAPRTAPPPLQPPRPASAPPRCDEAALQGGRVWGEENEQPKHSAKSTASEAQRQRALALLTTGPKTTIELRASGIFKAMAAHLDKLADLRDTLRAPGGTPDSDSDEGCDDGDSS
jgi:hypothetical protein